jgi:porin
MKPARIATLCLLALLIMCGALLAQNQGPWWTWSTFDGNWVGYRQTLVDEGVAVSGSTIVDLLGNVSGPVRAFAPANASLVAVDADLEKLLSLRGLLVHSEFVANAGENLSAKSIGNLLQVATAFAQPGYYLGQMFVQQKLFSDKLTLQVGRMTTANNFASLPVFANYVSFAINPIPINLTNNTVFFTSLPAVEWAAVGTIAPTDWLGFAVGVYNTNLPSGLPVASRHGVDFSFHGSGGPMEVAQLTYTSNRGIDDTGLPGTYYIGGFYSGAEYASLSDGNTRKGNYGFYLQGEQMIYRRGGPSSDVGLTPWISIAYTPQQGINQLPLLVMAGAAYHGLIPGRSDDSTAHRLRVSYALRKIVICDSRRLSHGAKRWHPGGCDQQYRTPSADQEAIATYYDQEAADAKERADLHRNVAETYQKLNVAKPVGMVNMCKGLLNYWDKVADQAKDFAKANREMAKATGGVG